MEDVKKIELTEEMEGMEAGDALSPAEKKEEKEEPGNYTHHFKSPVVIMGKTYKTMTFYFGRLTGADIEDIEDELMDQNRVVLSPETSSAFQCILAAKAAGVPSDEIRRLPVNEYMKIKNKARVFLTKAG